MELPEKLQNVLGQFSKLPGVGYKTALRQSLEISGWSTQEIKEFGESISEMVNLEKCRLCGIFSDKEICHICSSSYRNAAKTLCVVENISDFLAIERSEQFTGKYHIIGGVLNPLMGIGPDELRIKELAQRILEEDFESIILALNPSVEGDATCSYIKGQLPDGLNIERIGFGIPMGGNLEYLDNLTISKALENRKKL